LFSANTLPCSVHIPAFSASAIDAFISAVPILFPRAQLATYTLISATPA
jgi:hypothetical protein